MKLEKIGSSGSVFDMDKFRFINNFYLSKISNNQLYDETLAWARIYDEVFASLLVSHSEYALAAMSVERQTELDPKRFSTYMDVRDQIMIFFDDIYTNRLADKPARPSMITDDIARSFTSTYSQILDLSLSKEDRFAQLKDCAQSFGFAPTNADFKAGGYIGKAGDIAMFLRIQLACATATPDLYTMMQVMGLDRVRARLAYIQTII
jgi:glutamyl-tRNA synthetase